MNRLSLAGCVVVVGVSCAAPEESAIYVEENSLGIVSLETERRSDAGDAIFELRGLDARGEQIALMRHRIGYNEAVGEQGTEFTWEVGGKRDVAQTGLDVKATRVLEPKVLDFARLPEVQEIVQNELGIEIVAPKARDGEVAYNYADSCSAGEGRAGVLQNNCCRTKNAGGSTLFTTFRLSSSSKVEDKYFGHGFTYCRTSSGGTNCGSGTGSRCYTGPCGSTQPTQHESYNYIRWDSFDELCMWYTTSPNLYGDVNGSCSYKYCKDGVRYVNDPGGGGGQAYQSPTPW